VAPYLVTSTVEAILAQRLVRKVCVACARYAAPDERTARDLGIALQDTLAVAQPRGCDECRGTGFRGRTGIYELLVLDDTFRAELRARHDEADLRSLAVKHGMQTLREDGLRLIRAGVTSADEVLRVTRA
jgi:general secretion pathway protein E